MSEYTDKLSAELLAHAGEIEAEAARLASVANILRDSAAQLVPSPAPTLKPKKKARKKGKKRGRPTNAEIAAREAGSTLPVFAITTT